MKKVTLLFALAVLLPSLVLAWLALRSLRDQQFLLERQQSLLCQSVTDALAQTISDALAREQQEFAMQVEALAGHTNPPYLSNHFDSLIRSNWPTAEVGFCVTLSGQILSPLVNGREVTKKFYTDNNDFLGNRKAIEVYNNGNIAVISPNQSYETSIRNGSSLNWSSRNSSATSQQEAVSLPATTTIQVNRMDKSEALPGSNLVVESQAIFAQQPQAPSPPNNQPPGNEQQQRFNPQQQMVSVQNAVINNLRQVISQGANNARSQTDMSQSAQFFGQNNRNQASSQRLDRQLPATHSQTSNELQSSLANTTNRPATTSDISRQSYQGGGQNTPSSKSAQQRKVIPLQNIYSAAPENTKDANLDFNYASRVVAEESEFRQLVGNGMDGMFARFVQNKLRLMVWHRVAAQPDYVYGAQLDLSRVVDNLRSIIQLEPAMQDAVCLALLDDNAKPVVLSRSGFQAHWKRPFVATEVGEALPHWEVGAYLIDPARLQQAAHTTRLTLALLVALLLFVMVIGSWLVFRSLGQELKLARQKTDFVSNVSHELKTPLTSIRMFSELLAEGRVSDQAKQRSYLNIITAEAGRLTRLINNVLDFSRMERGEKKYHFQPANLTEIVQGAAETFRPHLETAGFAFAADLPGSSIPIHGDADALSQVLLNLLSNAEKYSNGTDAHPANCCCEPNASSASHLAPPVISPQKNEAKKIPGKEVIVQLLRKQSPLPHAEIKVMDRGSGVPAGCGEKIFEKFYRAHDSLSNGIQGSGLGLTIARQIARAHGGEVSYEPREGGGSCFIVRLPVSETKS